jgi:hypothetical protein
MLDLIDARIQSLGAALHIPATPATPAFQPFDQPAVQPLVQPQPLPPLPQLPQPPQPQPQIVPLRASTLAAHDAGLPLPMVTPAATPGGVEPGAVVVCMVQKLFMLLVGMVDSLRLRLAGMSTAAHQLMKVSVHEAATAGDRVPQGDDAGHPAEGALLDLATAMFQAALVAAREVAESYRQIRASRRTQSDELSTLHEQVMRQLDDKMRDADPAAARGVLQHAALTYSLTQKSIRPRAYGEFVMATVAILDGFQRRVSAVCDQAVHHTMAPLGTLGTRYRLTLESLADTMRASVA